MKIPVFHSFPKWQLSGVNTWTSNLVQYALENDTGFEHRVLITGDSHNPQQELEDRAIPYNTLDLPAKRSRSSEWSSLKTFLENHGPCVYIPNYDFHRSCSIGLFSQAVRVCAVIHSDEGCYYDEVRRIGTNFDAIIAVSTTVAEKIKARFPHLSSRLIHIPHGIPTPPPCSLIARASTGPIQLAYCNRLQQYQKRVFDLPLILDHLRSLNVDFHLTLAGDGPDAAELQKRIHAAGHSPRVTFHGRIPTGEVIEIFGRSDLFLLTSDFEGLPISLLEAMSVGCVPIVYEIESGIRDAITHGVDGFQVPHGEPAKMAQAIADLHNNRSNLASCAAKAREKILLQFSLEGMISDYTSAFQRIIQQAPVKRTGRVDVPFDLSVRGKILRRFRMVRGPSANP